MAGGTLVARAAIARTGRDHQRWDGPVRLVTGCIPLVEGKVVMISSGEGQKWIVPKGGWEDDETLEQAAAREAYEEAGVVGVLGSALRDTNFRSKKRGGPCRLFLFVLYVSEVLEKWPEGTQRRRRLVPVDVAIDECARPEMRQALIEMKARGLHLLSPTAIKVKGSDHLPRSCGSGDAGVTLGGSASSLLKSTREGGEGDDEQQTQSS